jgi:hypothetical protein
LLSAIDRRISLWQATALGIVGVALWDGIGYVSKGNKVAQGPSLAFLRSLPGGMKTHGWILVGIAVCILYTIHKPSQVYWALFVAFLYSVYVSCAIFWGWHDAHAVVWSAPSKWFFIAWVSVILMAKAEGQKNRQRTDR